MKALLLDPPSNQFEVMVTATIPIANIIDLWIRKLLEIKYLSKDKAEVSLSTTAYTIATQANIRAEALGVLNKAIIEIPDVSTATKNEPINLN